MTESPSAEEKIRVEVQNSEVIVDESTQTQTLYTMNVCTVKSGNKWSILKTWTDIEKLGQKMKGINPQINLVLPKKDGCDPMSDRRVSLQQFINTIISRPELCNSFEFRNFINPISPGSTIRASDSTAEGVHRPPLPDMTMTDSPRRLLEKRKGIAAFWSKGTKLRLVEPFQTESDPSFSCELGELVTYLLKMNDQGLVLVSMKNREIWIEPEKLKPISFIDDLLNTPSSPLTNSGGIANPHNNPSSSNSNTEDSPLRKNNQIGSLRGQMIKLMERQQMEEENSDEKKSDNSGNFRPRRTVSPPPTANTEQKVIRAKRFFLDYYKQLDIYLTSRQIRRQNLQDKLDKMPTEEARSDALKNFNNRESVFLRRRRKRVTLDDFEIIEMVGQGGFGKVYLSREKFTNDIVALKKIRKSVVVQRNKVESVHTEREVLKGVESPWLIKLLCSFQDKHYLYFAMEYAPGGNLKGLLDLGSLDDESSRFYAAEIVLSVHSLHTLGFVHRDLKPENFLFDRLGHLKLADFGLSKGGVIQRQTELQNSQITPVRVFLKDGTYRTLAATSVTDAATLLEMLKKKVKVPEGCFLWQLDTGDKTTRKIKGWELIMSYIPVFSHGASFGSALGGLKKIFFFGTEDGAKAFLNDPNSVLKAGISKAFGNTEEKNKRQSFNDTRRERRERLRRSTITQRESEKKAYSFVGSPHYMAPEVISRDGYDHLIDWWSVGCLIFELLYGFPPFDGETPHEVFDNIVDFNSSLVFPDNDEGDINVSEHAKELIKKFLCEASTRLKSFEEIKKQPWFVGFEWNNVRNRQPPFVPQLDGPTDTSYFHFDRERRSDSTSSNSLTSTLTGTMPTPDMGPDQLFDYRALNPPLPANPNNRSLRCVVEEDNNDNNNNNNHHHMGSATIATPTSSSNISMNSNSSAITPGASNSYNVYPTPKNTTPSSPRNVPRSGRRSLDLSPFLGFTFKGNFGGMMMTDTSLSDEEDNKK